MLRLTFICCCTILISACSNMQFSSNLDKKKFDEYFKPSEVTIYKKSELHKLEYEVLGAVEGSSCQEEIKDRPADIKEARTNARIRAAEMNANGIVLQSCLSFEQDKSCISNIVCYARALDVTLSDEE